MHTFRTITMISTILFGGLFAGLAPAAEFNPDCGVMANPVSALVWNTDSETWVARVVDIGRVEILPTAFQAPAPVQVETGSDANLAFDESLIGAGSVGAPKTLALDPHW